MTKPLGPTAFLGAFLAPRRTHPRLACKLALSFALLAAPTLPCSLMASTIGPPILGGDGEVHWIAPDPTETGHDRQLVSWLTLDANEPAMVSLVAPKMTEGQAILLQRLADGSSWWGVSCVHGYPRSTSVCASWLFIGPDGQSQARLPFPHFYSPSPQELPSDGSMRWLELEKPRTGPRILRLWRGTPVAMASLDEPTDPDKPNENPHADPENRATEPWEMVWETPFPKKAPTSDRRERWVFRDTTLGIATTSREVAEISVFQLKGSGSQRQLDILYKRTFPRATNGLATTATGEFALAPPTAMSLSTTGVLALGKWEINSDCSTDRPRGFVILDPRGNVAADVRLDGKSGLIDGLVFDARDQLVVATSDIKVYDSGGHLLRQTPRLPTLWTEQRNRLIRRIQDLNVGSPLEDWASLYDTIDRYATWVDPDPGLDTMAAIRRRLIEDWPTIDAYLPNPTWIEFAQDLCAEHPSSAPATALTRFQGATEREKTEWLSVLPHCFFQPPPVVQAHIDTLLTSNARSLVRSAEEALEAWTPDEEHFNDLWRQLETATRLEAKGGAKGYQERYRTATLQKDLLHLLPSSRTAIEEKLNASSETRALVRRVLLSSLIRWPIDYVPHDSLKMHAALLESAVHWASSKDPMVSELGGLLLLGHVGPNALPPLEAAQSMGASTENAPDLNGTPVAHLLRETLEASGDRWAWATVAVGRVMRSAFEDDGTERFAPGEHPGPAALGLPPVEVKDLYTKLLNPKRNGSASTESPEAGPLHDALDRSQGVLARSLGQDARTLLFDSAFPDGAFPGGASSDGASEDAHLDNALSHGSVSGSASANQLAWRRQNTHYQPASRIARWMTEDINPWSEEQIRTVLFWLEAQPDGAVETSPNLLAAIVERYKPEHPLHKLARRQFRALIDENVAYQSGPRNITSVHEMMVLPNALEHLADPARETGPSILLNELDSQVLRKILGDPKADRGGTQLSNWVNVISEVGPWQAALPDLHRMLESTYRASAAVILSTQRDKDALQVLLSKRFRYRPSVAQRARAIARYGTTGIGEFLELRLGELVDLERPLPPGASAAEDLPYVVLDHLEVLIKMLAENPAIKQAEELTPALDALANLVQSRLQSNPKARRETVKTLELLLETLGRTNN